MRWTVDYKPEVAKEIAEQVRIGKLTTDDIAAIRRWVHAIETQGLDAVQNEKWSDHPLEAEWTGFRAAGDRLIVWVVRVTATHSYRR